jgi:diphosphomevalonate decarboxylase
MSDAFATVRAHPNIAFIKYWGNRNDLLRLPANSSISMNLAGLYAETTVVWDENLVQDELTLNGDIKTGRELERVSTHLDVIRQRLGMNTRAQVVSVNNFPTGAGIASSAAAFAALTVAGVAAAGADLTERELSTIARRGSGSASRSVPAGFVQWYAADTHDESYAESVATPEHWNLVDVIAVVSTGHKEVGSTQGHPSAKTSDLQNARVAGAEERLRIVREAILARDFAPFAEVVEYDSNLMHAVMMTSRPPLFYWLPPTLTVMDAVRRWRADGLRVCYTLDAGPNIHCICEENDAAEVRNRLQSVSGVLQVIEARAGGAAHLVTT